MMVALPGGLRCSGKILIGVAAVLVLFVVVVATRPSAYHVDRSSPSLLHPISCSVFSTTSIGLPVSWSFSWSGKEVGKGKMTIEESVPGQKVRMKLEFVKPMESTATCALTLADTPTGSFVTWSMDGSHNFMGKAVGMFMNMDNMLGADIEKGLAQLKTVAEASR